VGRFLALLLCPVYQYKAEIWQSHKVKVNMSGDIIKIKPGFKTSRPRNAERRSAFALFLPRVDGR
jgi:hypothetical protein